MAITRKRKAAHGHLPTAAPRMSPVKRPGLAPNVSRALRLPHAIDDWHLMGPNWFRQGLVDFFADLPTHIWEDHRIFAEGALRVVCRLRQKSLLPPYAWPRRSERHPHVLSAGKLRRISLNREQLGLVKITCNISLFASDAELCKGICSLAEEERRRLGIYKSAQRPVDDENLKRNLVVYLLDREGWDRASIESQLAFMGCIPLPNTGSQKVLLRKIRAWFLKIEDEIVAQTADWRIRALRMRSPGW